MFEIFSKAALSFVISALLLSEGFLYAYPWNLTFINESGRSIVIENNFVSSYNPNIFKEKNLGSVFMKNNLMCDFPLDICSIQSLKILIISENQISLIPNEIKELSNLKYLGFTKTSIESIPDSVGYLSNLTHLILPQNLIKSISIMIGNLSNLQFINLKYNLIKTIPNSIGNLSNLLFLDFRYNQIQSIPSSIGNLSKLVHINLKYNLIKTLPDSIGNLSNLKYANFSENLIESIPDSIGNLSNLIYLNFSETQIELIPDSIGNLSNLSYLFLDETPIKSLPDTIGNLSNLSRLNLQNTQLQSIPESICKMKKLKILNLSNNKFVNLPRSFQNTCRPSKSAFINLFGNPLQEIGSGFSLGRKELERVFGDSILLSNREKFTEISKEKACENMMEEPLYWNLKKLSEHFFPHFPKRLETKNDILDKMGALKSKISRSKEFIIKRMDNHIRNCIEKLYGQYESYSSYEMYECFADEAKNLLRGIFDLLLFDNLINSSRKWVLFSFERIREALYCTPDEQITDLRLLYLDLLEEVSTNNQTKAQDVAEECARSEKFIKNCISVLKDEIFNIVTAPYGPPRDLKIQNMWRGRLKHIIGFDSSFDESSAPVNNLDDPWNGSAGNVLHAFFTKFTVEDVVNAINEKAKKFPHIISRMMLIIIKNTHLANRHVGTLETWKSGEAVKSWIKEYLVSSGIVVRNG